MLKKILLTLSALLLLNQAVAKSTDEVEVIETTSEKTVTDVETKVMESTSEKRVIDTKDNVQLFDIASGTIGGNYFLLGDLIGSIISHPKGSLACGKGGSCGVLQLQTRNISSLGSVDNIHKIEDMSVDVGFVQADVAYWAYTATGIFAGNKKLDNLRAIASLYPEAMHILVRKDAKINTIADLKGKRVAIGDKNSGTVIAAQMILESYSLPLNEVTIEYSNVARAIEELEEDKLDALFFFVGYPAPFLKSLDDTKKYKLLSIDKSELSDVLTKGYYFAKETIPENTYPGIPNKIQTISTYALLVANKEMNDDLIYKVTKALWNENSKILFNNSAIGSKISVERSLNGIGIPLHEGARKYYNEIGKKF